jgi:hypothetical protein
MFGPPKDVEGECNERIELADDYGDNVCTIRCPLPKGHEGLHIEKFDYENCPVTISWDKPKGVS